MTELLPYFPQILGGVWLTVALTLCSILLTSLLGAVTAAAKLSRSRPLSTIADAYTSIVRGLPELVLMLLIYFGGQMLLNDLGEMTGWWERLELSAFVSAVLALGFVFGSYAAETFRGAYLAISSGQRDAARALGLSAWQTFRLVLWRQFVIHALPSFRNNFLVLLKATAFASVLGLHDMVYRANVAGRATHEPFVFLTLVAVVYFALALLSERGFSATLRWAERGWRTS